MKKIIIAIGGGYQGEHKDTYTDIDTPNGEEYFPADTTPIDKRIIAATGKKRPKVLLITTATEDNRLNDTSLFVLAFTKLYVGLGAKVDVLKLLEDRPPDEVVSSKIDDADAIYVSGGNTSRLIATWKRCGVDKLLRKAYEGGTVMSGLSAGAICWFKYGNSDSFANGLFRVSGMGWIDALLCPHYDTEPKRQPALKNMMKRTKGVAIALDQLSAIEIVDDEYRILSADNKAEAKKCYWKDNEYIAEDITVREEYTSLEKLLNY